MRAASRCSLWLPPRRPARYIAGRRFPLHSSLSSSPTRRDLHTSPATANAANSSSGGSTIRGDQENSKRFGWNGDSFLESKSPSDPSSAGTALIDVLSAQDAAQQEILNAPSPIVWNESVHKDAYGREQSLEDNETKGEREGTRSRIAATKRSLRSKRPKEIPPVKLPVWFLERNVKLNRPGYNELQPGPLEVISNADDWIRKTDFYDTQALLRSSLIERQISSELGQKTESEIEEQIGAFSTCLSQSIKSLERIASFEEGKSNEAEEASLFAEASTRLEELHKRIRLVRAEKIVERVLSVVVERFPYFRDEINEFRESERIGKQTEEVTRCGSLEVNKVYQLQLSELKAYISTALGLPGKSTGKNGVSDTFPSSRAHLRLLCPVDGGDYFVEKLVENCASQLNACFIRVDAQDLAEIGGEYIQEGSQANSNSLWNLSYETSQAYNQRRESVEAEEEEEEGEDAESKEDETASHDDSILPGRFPVTGAIPIMSISGSSIRDAFKKLLRDPGLEQFAPNGKSAAQGAFPGLRTSSSGSSRQWNDIKLTALVETILDANHVKHLREVLTAQSLMGRIQQKIQAQMNRSKKYQISYHSYGDELSLLPNTALSSDNPDRSGTVVLIRGFNELQNSTTGARILDRLVEAVQRRRNSGDAIMVVGTTASSNILPKLSGDGLIELQAEESDSVFRSLVVTPASSSKLHLAFAGEYRERIKEINTRHLHSLLYRLRPSLPVKPSLDEFAQDLQHALLFTPLSDKLTEQALTLDDVHRIICVVLGRVEETQDGSIGSCSNMGGIVAGAMRLLAESDDLKAQWLKNDRSIPSTFLGMAAVTPTKTLHATFGADLENSLGTNDIPEQLKEEISRKLSTEFDSRLSKILRTCTPHEKTLSKGIINPHSIKTTFEDVHAPFETIEALKTLTTLSLKRPDAFKYGVLAEDKISGLLLYGPPGTGKTLLARAVAKETGSTVLEVSGSDIYDMYVGEGEKKVRAVFDLAKKLSPCVVFIDEADAIFASRGSARRNSHRELINQFLREMDGMIKTTAFIMVATNRPFDLDDAALRRLPRRLLVDLPDEKDREAILRIHLRGEVVEPAVSIAELASQTPLYSGSDLKNLVVAAALAAVREENEIAEKHTGEEPYKHREKRILTQQHFDRAMEEISASVNEDMGSLKAIKKFDEKYGDRRGRRKKTVYGFSGDLGQDEKEETVKVRS